MTKELMYEVRVILVTPPNYKNKTIVGKVVANSQKKASEFAEKYFRKKLEEEKLIIDIKIGKIVLDTTDFFINALDK